MRDRSLALRWERLTELARPELAGVVAAESTTRCATVPLARCLSIPTFETTCRTCE